MNRSNVKTHPECLADPTQVYACKLCHRTSRYLASICRHIKDTVHKIPNEPVEQFFEIRKIGNLIGNSTVMAPIKRVRKSTASAVEKEDKGPKKVSPKSNKCHDVGCQASCLECERLKKRFDELNGIYQKILRDGEKAKLALAKLG